MGLPEFPCRKKQSSAGINVHQTVITDLIRVQVEETLVDGNGLLLQCRQLGLDAVHSGRLHLALGIKDILVLVDGHNVVGQHCPQTCISWSEQNKKYTGLNNRMKSTSVQQTLFMITLPTCFCEDHPPLNLANFAQVKLAAKRPCGCTCL